MSAPENRREIEVKPSLVQSLLKWPLSETVRDFIVIGGGYIVGGGLMLHGAVIGNLTETGVGVGVWFGDVVYTFASSSAGRSYTR